MERSFEREILERSGVTEEQEARSYHELAIINRLLGNTRYLIHALRSDPLPVRRVLDIGCGSGEVLRDVTQALGVEGIGIDVSPGRVQGGQIVRANAVTDLLPEAEVAYSTFVAHHLCETDLIQMIRNVRRSSRRFILVDLVRCWIPLSLFRVFIAPFVSTITGADGQTSIRRAYTPRELRAVVADALSSTNARFRHSVAAFWVRQVVDISYAWDGRRSDNVDVFSAFIKQSDYRKTESGKRFRPHDI
jgi:SAM-dependent methyltransferase